MTQDEAKQWVEGMRQGDGELYSLDTRSNSVVWLPSNRSDDEIKLSGWFRPAQLRALADYMEGKRR